MMVEAETALRAAARLGQPGRFQTEAAIQSLHAQSRMTVERLHGPLAQLYDVLARFAPTTGVLVARAVALAENCEADAALSQLDAITGAEAYQPWWAARARILWLSGQEADAREAASRAAGLSSDPGIRRFLLAGGYQDGPRRQIRGRRPRVFKWRGPAAQNRLDAAVRQRSVKPKGLAS